MTILQRLRNKRAQAMVETALILPFLTLLTLGAADLGRAFYLHLEITGAARAGMRNAIQGTGTDVGDALRSEPNSAIVDTPHLGIDGNRWQLRLQSGNPRAHLRRSEWLPDQRLRRRPDSLLRRADLHDLGWRMQLLWSLALPTAGRWGSTDRGGGAGRLQVHADHAPDRAVRGGRVLLPHRRNLRPRALLTLGPYGAIERW